MSDSDITGVPFAPEDGRYHGEIAPWFLELRMERAGAGIVSGDLFLAGPEPRDHLMSFRTRSGVVQPDGFETWPVRCWSSDGRTAGGTLLIGPDPSGAGAVSVTVTSDRQLNGLSAGDPVTVTATRQSAAYRALGLEQEIEAGVIVPGLEQETEAGVVPGLVDLDGVAITLDRVMTGAGIEVTRNGRESLIPRHDEGWEWHEGDVHDVLHIAMQRRAQVNLRVPNWQVQLLLLSRATTDWVYGVMFDIGGFRPRQGCAVFADRILDNFPDDYPRQLMYTMAHEVGHTLNLTHRFEPLVGRPHSTSIMNYAAEFRHGPEEFWNRFTYSFDPDELAFLHHGPRSEVMPGTAPFHSADYWSSAPGADPAFVPAESSPGLELSLQPPVGGPEIPFGQPVFVQASLRNGTSQPVRLPQGALDVKAGLLEILVERNPGPGDAALSTARSFRPMFQRCGSAERSATTALACGQVQSRNLSLAYGADGIPLAEPGRYRLTPFLTVPDHSGDRARSVVRGTSLTLRVGYPPSRTDERHGTALMEPDISTFMALGGSHLNARVPDRLRAIHAERQRARNRGMAAAIARSLGIYYSRDSVRLVGDRLEQVPAEKEQALKFLSPLAGNRPAQRCFDDSTIENTEKLISSLR